MGGERSFTERRQKGLRYSLLLLDGVTVNRKSLGHGGHSRAQTKKKRRIGDGTTTPGIAESHKSAEILFVQGCEKREREAAKRIKKIIIIERSHKEID